MKTVMFRLPYKLKGVESVTPEQLARAQSNITEQFILGAAGAIHPQGLTRQDAKVFRVITDALTDEAPDVTLDETQFAFLHDLFYSKDADQKVKFPPAAAGWLTTWLQHLEDVRRDTS